VIVDKLSKELSLSLNKTYRYIINIYMTFINK
jgi:hypothetical protein